tara:strand:+ start:167 stop:475 length:309 start_codon:yes stop_codon:yes gene_type:complete
MIKELKPELVKGRKKLRANFEKLKVIIMTEDIQQKQIRLTKELAQVKAQTGHASRDKVRKTEDKTMGFPADNSHKASPSSADVPDVVSLPPKRRGKSENIPF